MATTVILLVCTIYLDCTTSRRFWLLVGVTVVGILIAYPIVFTLPGIILTVCFAPTHFGSALPSATGRKLVPLQRGFLLALAASGTFFCVYSLFISPNISPSLQAFWWRGDDNLRFAHVAMSKGSALLQFLFFKHLP